MSISIGEKVKILMKRRGMTLGELAEATGQTRQNLSNKMSRDNFTERDAAAMAAALGCTFTPLFTMEDTGEAL